MGNMMIVFAELEANLLSKRTKKCWMLQEREEEKKLPSLPVHKKRRIKFLYDGQKLTGGEIAKQIGVSRSTVYRIVKN